MSDYIKWFCEDFLEMRYDSKQLLSIWMTMKKDMSNTKMNFVSCNIVKYQQQLTIFDI